MRWLLKSVTLVAPGNALNGKKRDILIENGIISEIKASIPSVEAEVIRIPNLLVSLGWVDSKADFRDPGEEYKEGLANGLDAAAAGGFTHVVTMPRTTPVIDHRAQLEYLIHRGQHHAVRVLPTGCISAKGQGEQLAELYDMHQAGAVAFTDDRPIERAELMRRALEYSSTFGAVIATLPWDQDLLGKGQMHEGLTSTSNGLKGIPAMAEIVRLQRDIEILKYTGGRLHVQLIASAEAVKLIRQAKKDGLQITCGVSAHHLYFNDTALSAFNANLKTLPPLRGESDRKALLKGLEDGVIDLICSDHQPEDVEHKDLEFVRANFGIGAIENTFNAALAAGVSPENFVERVAHAPRSVFNLNTESLEIKEGMEADLTLFSSQGTTLIDRSDLVSKAYNNPYLGHQLPGKVYGIIRGSQVMLR
jgi:dihydroorotase